MTLVSGTTNENDSNLGGRSGYSGLLRNIVERAGSDFWKGQVCSAYDWVAIGVAVDYSGVDV